MSHLLTCSRGHLWELPVAAAGAGGPSVCPVCGSTVQGEVPNVPGYEILRELRRDGLGTVYEARQMLYDRHVQLRVIAEEALGSAKDLTPFCHAGRLAARLQHPHIAAVYEAGNEDGLLYLASELPDGESLKHRLADALPSARQAAQLLETLARALAYAHEHNVPHLALSPGCIFLESDRPRITDFGLAPYLGGMPTDFHPEAVPRHIESRWGWQFTVGSTEETPRTPVSRPSGSRVAFVGNPAYLAPEQINGPATVIGPATDVYGLGTILYQTLTGRPPFFASSAQETLRLARSGSLLPPRFLQPSLPRDLEAICLKCLQRRPERRYASAAALADDLRRFQDGMPIQSGPARLIARVGHWCRSNLVAIGLIAVLLVLTVLMQFFGMRQLKQATRAREDAETERVQAQERGEEALRLRDAEAAARIQALEQIRQTEQAKEEMLRQRDSLRDKAAALQKNLENVIRQRDEITNAKALAERAAEAAGQETKQAQAQRELFARRLVQAHTTAGLRLLDEGNLTGSLVWLTEALRLAQQERLPDDLHRQRVAAVLERCPRLVQLWSFDKKVNQVQVSPDARRLLAALADGAVTLWDLNSGQRVGEPLQHDAAVIQALFSPDGQRILTVTTQATVHLWDLASAKESISPLEFETPVEGVAFSPEGRSFLTVTRGNGEDPAEAEVRVWDTARGTAIGRKILPHRLVAGLPAFSPDGKRLLTACLDRCARLWDLATGEQIGPSLQQGSTLTGVALSADGRYALTADRDGVARVWNASSGQPVTRPLRHGSAVRLAAFSPESRHLFTACLDRTVHVWDTTTGEQIGLSLRNDTDILQAAFSPDGRHLLTAEAAGSVRVWNIFNGEEAVPPLIHGSSLHAAAFTPQGRSVLTLSGSTVRLWDLTSAAAAAAAVKSAEPSRFAAFSPDGKLAVRGTGTEVEIINRATGQRLGGVLKHTHPVVTMAFSPNSRRVLTVTRSGDSEEAEGIVHLWEAESGKPVGKTLDHLRPVLLAMFSPDSKRVLTASGEKKVRIWDVESGEQVGSVLEQDEAVTGARFSPDGQLILVAEADGRVRLWETATGKRVGNALGHARAVTHLQFSQDGRRILTASSDHTARVWDAETGQPITAPLRQEAPILQVAFSPDGSRVATGCTDGTVRVWDVGTSRLALPLLRQHQAVNLVAFSADGRRLASASGNYVRVWDVATGEPLGPELALGKDGQILNYLAFTTEGGLVTAAGTPGDPLARQTWLLQREGRPAADLATLAQVLAGQRLDETGRLQTLEDAELVKTWRDLRTKPAPDFTLSAQRALAWDRQGAEECERHQLWSGAVQHIDQLIEAKDGGWELFARRARALTELHRWEPALADFSRALEHKPDHAELWSGRATAAAHLGRWEQVVVDLTRAIELRPRDAELLARRGRAEAERGRWEQAAADLGKATRMGLNDVNAWHEEALLLLAREDTRSYQRTCASMARRFSAAEEETTVRILARTCALGKDALADLKPLLARAERIATANPTSGEGLRTLAALLYRAGQFEEAQRRAEAALRLPSFDHDPICGFLLAMIHQQLNHADEAKPWLQKAVSWADEAVKIKPGSAPLSWSQRLELQVFRREAEQRGR